MEERPPQVRNAIPSTYRNDGRPHTPPSGSEQEGSQKKRKRRRKRSKKAPHPSVFPPPPSSNHVDGTWARTAPSVVAAAPARALQDGSDDGYDDRSDDGHDDGSDADLAEEDLAASLSLDRDDPSRDDTDLFSTAGPPLLLDELVWCRGGFPRRDSGAIVLFAWDANSCWLDSFVCIAARWLRYDLDPAFAVSDLFASGSLSPARHVVVESLDSILALMARDIDASTLASAYTQLSAARDELRHALVKARLVQSMKSQESLDVNFGFAVFSSMIPRLLLTAFTCSDLVWPPPRRLLLRQSWNSRRSDINKPLSRGDRSLRNPDVHRRALRCEPSRPLGQS